MNLKTSKTWNEYLTQLKDFEDRILKALNQLGIKDSCQTLDIDHACIRFSNANDVDALRDELKHFGHELSCTEVNGRDIVIVQLDTALQIADWNVQGLELPYPKQNQTVTDGWEHVEFVLPDALNSVEGMREAFFGRFGGLELATLETQYQYKEDSPHAAGEQLANPTVAIKVDGIGLKFHANSIQDIVGSG